MLAAEIHGSDFLSAGDKALIVSIFVVPLVVAFVVGLVIGSLCNVVIYRLVHYRSIWSPPSHCPRCRNEIPWYDNIPILSWIFLRGRCRFCKGPISLRYPVVELISGLLYAGIMYRFLYAPYLPADELGQLRLHFDITDITTILFLFKCYIFATFILILAAIDIEHMLLPNRLTVSGAVIGVLLSPFILPGRAEVFPNSRLTLFNVPPPLDGILQSVLGLVAGGGVIFIFFVIGYLIYRRVVMGIGDLKLAGMIGAFVGLSQIGPALFVGFVVGGIMGVLFWLFRLAGLKSFIPLGPYLCIGGFVGLLWGPNLMHMYLNYLHLP